MDIQWSTWGWIWKICSIYSPEVLFALLTAKNNGGCFQKQWRVFFHFLLSHKKGYNAIIYYHKKKPLNRIGINFKLPLLIDYRSKRFSNEEDFNYKLFTEHIGKRIND